MASKFQAPRGTFDVLPGAWRARARIEAVAAGVFERAGYETIQTPTFEHTDLFERGVGKSTDIVRKEMFTFEDKGDRSLTLRPEGTAPICRAYLEHGMHKLAQPVKLAYTGPFFRHERPQAGRYRQFHQFGMEAIGTDWPLADAEVIMLLSDILGELGVPGVALRLGSLGSLAARAAYLEELKAHLHRHEGDLTADVRERIDINPLRAFDSDDDGVRGVMASAPTILDALSEGDGEHFAEVRALLDAAGIDYEVDATLVRGIDYYTRTIFSFVCEALGSVSEIGGGGRYDGLIEQLGGPATPAVGWAAGYERVLLALDEEEPRVGRDAFVATADPEQRRRAMALVTELRNAGFSAEMDLGGRGLKGQLKHADRIGAARVLILEADGTAQLRDMTSGEQRAADTGNLLGEMTGGEA
ncbi:MAG TPA: histidine--tRNA ligase [Solirubrobacterales bacterium]|jgi:histidyl-tRNA synthetase|nr:histidine--tRNA ligase [Solirubrobacterales bacterium]